MKCLPDALGRERGGERLADGLGPGDGVEHGVDHAGERDVGTGEDVVRSVAVDADVELVGLYLGLLGEPESGLTTSMDVRMWR